MSRQTHNPDVYRITAARHSLSEDIRGRQRRYIISMGFRTLCVILTVVLWQVSRPLAFATLVLGMLLPYVAVVIANAGRENAPGLPDTFVGPQVPPMLGDDPAQKTSRTDQPGRTEDRTSTDEAAEQAEGAHRPDPGDTP
jgi:hypothetical protein